MDKNFWENVQIGDQIKASKRLEGIIKEKDVIGEVKWFHGTKGFILNKEGDIFAHQGAIYSEDKDEFRKLEDGQRVIYHKCIRIKKDLIIQNNNGYFAAYIRKV